ncbi:Hypothetical predicted protein [Paramuricea clavata]|nr:Hypothetical predicted protein [Paramuricea clavata]
MDLFPLNPLMRSLTESKSEVNDKTSEIHNDSNGNTTKEVENKNYTDLPKSGIHYVSHKIKTQLITCYENDESYGGRQGQHKYLDETQKYR